MTCRSSGLQSPKVLKVSDWSSPTTDSNTSHVQSTSPQLPSQVPAEQGDHTHYIITLNKMQLLLFLLVEEQTALLCVKAPMPAYNFRVYFVVEMSTAVGGLDINRSPHSNKSKQNKSEKKVLF